MGLTLILLSSVATAAGADGFMEGLDTTLSLRGDAWSGTRQLDDVKGSGQISAWGQFKLTTESAGRLVGGGWLREHTGNDADTPRGRLRELYWLMEYDPFEVPFSIKIGRQLVVWGRADGLNPTDNLSQRDFTLLVPEDGDQRYGNEAVQVAVDTRIGQISGLWFARGVSYTIPLAQQASLTYAIEKPPEQAQWALKWEGSTDGMDGSLSYFNGIDPMPDLALAAVAPGGLTVLVRNHPMRVLGADLSLTRGDVVWRAEAAWTDTDSTGPSDFSRKKSQWWLVGGGEWTLGDTTTLGLQGSLQRVMDFASPDAPAAPFASEIAWRQAATSHQTAATQAGITWRLARRWLNDTLMAETSGVVVSTAGDGVWRTKMNYAVSDHWNLQVGSDYYFGPELSFFGQLNKNSLVYVQLRLS